MLKSPSKWVEMFLHLMDLDAFIDILLSDDELSLNLKADAF